MIHRSHDPEKTTAWSGVWWPFDVFTLAISDSAKITLLVAMEHQTRPEPTRENECPDWEKSYPTTEWLVERRGLSRWTIRRHTNEIREALGGLW